jgi:hypothetical protein
MHDEGGCALAECDCHELVGERRQAAAWPGRLAVDPPVEVNAVELVNGAGLPLYASLSYDHASGTLTIRTGVLS